MTSLWRFLQAVLGRRRSTDSHDAKASARRYWRAKVEEEREHVLPKPNETPEERPASQSAQHYWEREVADEKKRRGTPDKPQR